MNIFKRFFLFAFTVITATLLQAQPFIGEIREFKKMDSISAPPEHSILFVGSSSFRMWSDVSDYFPGYTIINRGFGGSTLLDVIRYEKDIILPYKPKQVVIYCGENDIAADSAVTGKTVYKRFKKLFHDIRKQFPDVMITYVSIKPSPSRWHLRNKMLDGNKRIEKFLARRTSSPPSHFINVWDSMLGPDGEPLPDIFIEDNLHMNKKGYAIWQKLIEPYLIK